MNEEVTMYETVFKGMIYRSMIMLTAVGYSLDIWIHDPETGKHPVSYKTYSSRKAAESAMKRKYGNDWRVL